MKKKYMFSNYFNKKEFEGDLYVEGFVSTPDADSVRDIVPIEVQQQIVDQINNHHRGIAHKGSLHHDWIVDEDPEADIFSLAEEAKLVDGKAYIRAKINKMHPEYDKKVHEISEGIIDSFSIEFDDQTSSFHYEQIGGNTYRVFDKIDLLGYGFASRPVNPEAKITNAYFKEIIREKKMETKEEKKASSTEEVKDTPKDNDADTKTTIKPEPEIKKEDFEALKKELEETKAKLNEIEDEKTKEKADKLLAEKLVKIDAVIDRIDNNTKITNLPLKNQEGQLEKSTDLELELSKETVRKYIAEAKDLQEKRKRVNEMVKKLGFR